MFIQYYRYQTRYLAKQIVSDPRLTIRYPSDEHAMITAGHDFYVIGTFQGFMPEPDALLKVELIDQQKEEVIRTVTARKKDFRQGINTSYAGIETLDPEETVRSSGMPDLVYDPEHPESFWYTWNKAYYTDQVFSALICGGTCRLDGSLGLDQNGRPLEPVPEGIYEIRVTLENKTETIVSAKTIRMATGQKEVILSRFSPESHVERVRRFAREGGFEEFTDPYAGIWDTQYFGFPWPVKAAIEIPARWHFGDAQEYESGKVHFFDYHLSRNCIGWKTEVGTMLASGKECVDDLERMITYYYQDGSPDAGEEKGCLKRFMPGKYFAVTSRSWQPVENGMRFVLDGVCKPIPSDVVPITGCSYEITNRISILDYAFYRQGEKYPFWKEDGCETGILHTAPDGTEEQLLLQVHHEFTVEGCKEGERISLSIRARDCEGTVRSCTVLELK